MKKRIKLPTIIVLLVLLIGVITGIYFINSKQIFKLAANIEAVPKNVRFTNITDTGVTISWTTEIESNGFVKWGTTANSLSEVSLEENSNKSLVHSVNIIGSKSNADIFLIINSNNVDYYNENIPWQAKTLIDKVKSNNSLIASGTVLLQDGVKPAKSLVYLSINGTMLSTITSDEGSFVIPISSYVENIAKDTITEIVINAGLNNTSQAVIYTKAIKSIPTMIIGKTYDFRSLEITDSNDLPQSSISIPESVEKSSRFEVQKTQPIQTGEVRIESINEGEIITTINPEFFGKGPKNTDIQVEVQSELQQATVTTDSNGLWNWSPPANLEAGEHTVTLKWRDANGILRTITRNFVVQAAEGPAFESTPSATPIKTVAPTNTPVVTPIETTISTPLATLPPTPETGSLTPTIGLFIMGIGILLSSIFVWNKSYA